MPPLQIYVNMSYCKLVDLYSFGLMQIWITVLVEGFCADGPVGFCLFSSGLLRF
jgi:hypothetical protein